MKLLLMVMAVVEAIVGIGFFIVPARTISALLETELGTPGGIAMARLAGAALISLAIACWLARNSERGGAATGVVTAMLFFNAAAAAVLVYAGIRLGLQSLMMWPAILLHCGLAAWCFINLWVTRRKLAAE